MNLLRNGRLHVLEHLDLEERAEEIGEEEARAIHALIGIGITVVVINTLVRDPQQLAGHVRKEAGLLVGLLDAANVGIEFVAEKVLDGGIAGRLTRPDIDVLLHPEQRILLGEYGGCLCNRLDHESLEDLVLVIAQNHAYNLLVLDDAEGAKQNEEGNLGFHARNGGAQIHDLLVLGVVLDAHRVRLGNLLIHGADGFHLNHLPLLRGIAVVAEYHGAILRHALLADNRALTAADDKVAAEVLRALAEVERCDVLLVAQQTQLAAHHHGNLAEMYIREDALVGCLAAILVINARRRHIHIDSERRRVGQIAEPGVIGKHGQNRTIVLKDGRLAQLRLQKLDLDLVLIAHIRTQSGGGSRGGGSCSGILNHLTHQSIRRRRGKPRRGCECRPWPR